MEKLWYKIFGSNKEVVIERYQTIEKHITVRILKYEDHRISVFQFTHATYRECSLIIVNEFRSHSNSVMFNYIHYFCFVTSDNHLRYYVLVCIFMI